MDAFNHCHSQRWRWHFKSGQATANKRSLVYVRGGCAGSGLVISFLCQLVILSESVAGLASPSIIACMNFKAFMKRCCS